MQKSQLSEKGPYNAISTELMTEGSSGSGFFLCGSRDSVCV